jgi:ABC-type nickel/cobalt efflux system permease component RcnA
MITFLTGFIASVAHVATGPDHLAAVTPLAIDSRKKSWIIGLLWGVGHTLGMLLIGLLFILFKELLPIDSISKYSETVIGVLLIGIGSWALLRMYLRHSHGYKPHGHFHTRPFFYAHIHKHDHPNPPVVDHHPHMEHLHLHDHDHDHDHTTTRQHEHTNTRDHDHTTTRDHDQVQPQLQGFVVHDRRPVETGHSHAHHVTVIQNGLSALFIGIIHGFAGFSHLFALLPSLALPTMIASVVYVIAFATGTILTMILFAFILGLVAFRSEVKQQQVFLKWFSFSGAVLAIAIGILWIFNPF